MHALRKLRRLPGWQGVQVFKSLGTEDELYALVDFESPEGFSRGQRDALSALSRHEGLQGRLDLFPLAEAYVRHTAAETASTSLLRLTWGVRETSAPTRLEREYALQAMAAPGAVRVLGALDGSGDLGCCRVCFVDEDGLWHFYESTWRRKWSRRCSERGERETWALDLPRLSRRAAAVQPIKVRKSPRVESLCIRMEFTETTSTVALVLEGTVTDENSAQFQRVCGCVAETGCKILKVDLSSLESITPRAMQVLTETSRRVKALGGALHIVDNADRARRITRSRHLAASVS